MKVRKAVVTAAGWGTRFLPATKAQPKEMLPLIDKPVIQYVIEEAVASGITQIIIVTALGKRAIEDHFDRSAELEQALRAKGEAKRLAEVQRLSNLADISYIRQKEQLGLGHAVLTAKYLVGDEPFALLLPDDVIVHTTPCLKQMLRAWERLGGSLVAVQKVRREEAPAYGIIRPRPLGGRLYGVEGLVEKPSPQEAPSNLGIVGRYILSPSIFAALEATPRGRGGELQLTDGLERLRPQEPVFAYEFLGKRHDTGTPLGLLKAAVALALAREDLGAELQEYLRGLKL
ncbi:MAG: UTP--glucose-1-phosphate uridylyltransferase GalU [Chloroflexi bacterium]|nr:UTP--glucose-1-phosphate uridylyltransferase GalU [Chloroflexota bacterium]